MTWVAPVVILDLDDTVIDYTGASEACWRGICEEAAGPLGVECGQLHTALMAQRVAFWADPELNLIGRHDLMAGSRIIVGRTLEIFGIGDETFAVRMAQQYHDRRVDLVYLFPESISTLEALRERGHRLAMITNGGAEGQRAKIVRFDLEKHFDYIVVEGEFGHGKPDERVYRHALEQLGVEASEAMMVGDDLERDVAGPQRVGMCGVWVDRAGNGLPTECTIRPDRIIDSLAALL
jgi:putative hydrolase of the HAD superfamily